MDQYFDDKIEDRSYINTKDENDHNQKTKQDETYILPQIVQSPKLIVIESVLNLSDEERKRMKKVYPNVAADIEDSSENIDI